MTLIELQEKLGKQIDELTDPRVPFESKKRLLISPLWYLRLQSR